MKSGDMASSPLTASNEMKPASTNQNSHRSCHSSGTTNQSSSGSGQSPPSVTRFTSGTDQSLNTKSHGKTSLLASPSTTVPELGTNSRNITTGTD